MNTDDEMFIALILVAVSFVPVAIWILLHAWEYVAHRWVRPRVCKDRILRDVAWMGRKGNYRVLR